MYRVGHESHRTRGRTLFGGLGPGVTPQTRFIDRRGDAGPFDFEQRTWLALPEQARMLNFLPARERARRFTAARNAIQRSQTGDANEIHS